MSQTSCGLADAVIFHVVINYDSLVMAKILTHLQLIMRSKFLAHIKDFVQSSPVLLTCDWLIVFRKTTKRIELKIGK